MSSNLDHDHIGEPYGLLTPSPATTSKRKRNEEYKLIYPLMHMQWHGGNQGDELVSFPLLYVELHGLLPLQLTRCGHGLRASNLKTNFFPLSVSQPTAALGLQGE